MSFAIHNGSTFEVPPAAAKPDVNAPALVRWPEPFYSVSALPAQHQKPFSIVGREYISQTGLNWWIGFIGTEPSVAVRVRLLDPRTGTWKSYDGFMASPSFDPVIRGGRYYPNFVVVFRNLEES